ncbi:MAG: type IX secretion system membrane protein PorP/SprF [Cyclobacteriaceae bacterium]
MKKSVVIVLILIAGKVAAQQQATYAQYMFNAVAINPAYAGTHEALSVSALARFQNVGLSGAPNTQSLAIHSPLPNERVAVGLLVVHDKIGVIGQTGLNGMYVYRLPMPNGAKLSMGIQAGFSSYRASYSQLELYQPDVLFNEDVTQTRPNIGAGLFYSTNLFYAGISMPHIVNNVFSRSTNFRTVYQSVPVILTGGYVITLHEMIKLKPNFLFKFADNRPVEFELNANMLFDEVLWAGLSYRFSNAITLLTELQATDQIRIGYSYTLNTGTVRTAEIGSHELLINYRFKFNMRGIVTPRYF